MLCCQIIHFTFILAKGRSITSGNIFNLGFRTNSFMIPGNKRRLSPKFLQPQNEPFLNLHRRRNAKGIKKKSMRENRIKYIIMHL